jgi:hypothetical protein
MTARTASLTRTHDLANLDQYDPRIDDNSALKPTSALLFPLRNREGTTIAVVELLHLQVIVVLNM